MGLVRSFNPITWIPSLTNASIVSCTLAAPDGTLAVGPDLGLQAKVEAATVANSEVMSVSVYGATEQISVAKTTSFRAVDRNPTPPTVPELTTLESKVENAKK